MSAIRERILRAVKIDANGCWVWTSGMCGGGYGSIYLDGADRRAHRVAYEAFVGPIPEGLHLDHLCRVRPCVNPEHLEPVTCRENTLRGLNQVAVNAVKTSCDRGHPFDLLNTHFRPDGKRRCRTCDRDRKRASRLAVAS